jgi:hypothetical protein
MFRRRCVTYPCFGLRDQSAEYCSKHKKIDMINVIKKKCKHCESTARYNKAGLRPEYCTRHKTNDMIKILLGSL